MFPKTKLFCLPHAGGLSTVYHSWKEYVSDDIEVVPIELAGRGKRINTPLYESMEEAIADLYHLMKPHLDGSPFALFGHSLGTLLAYELIQKIYTSNGIKPVHAFFSGRMPVHIASTKRVHELPVEELKKYIIKLGGIPPELLEYNEIFDIFLPIIKSDFKLVETYENKNAQIPFPFDISILFGYDDKLVNQNRLKEWTNYTNKKCDFYGFQGGHFFINDFTSDVVKVINNKLSHSLYRSIVN